MKKTLAIILSVIMLLGVMPFASFAADEPVYDRGEVAANNEAYIDGMSAEQIASLILDWVDRKIAKYSADIKEDITAGIIANGGFEEFEAFLGEDALGNIIADAIGPIDSLDAVIGYKSYLKELGGDFANLDATALVTRAEAGSALGFIYGVFEFMAANSETFGKVFRWDEEVFDYGKVGEYIETFNGSDNADEQAIYDFYVDYLIGNDIQAKFTKWVADQMNYEIPEGETFDDTLNNGIMAWFSGVCEEMGILSQEALAELREYDLRTTDIYTLIKNFVALAEEDNEVKLDTYYNYIMDTVVRTLIKTMLGQKAVVGAEAEVPAGFTATYADLALLEEISGGTVYYKDGDNYYQVTVADGAVTANALTWEAGFEMNLEPIYVPVLTGADRKTEVHTYEPKSTDISISTYASEKNQNLVKDTGLTFTGTEVPADIAELMSGNSIALTDGFLLKVTQGEQEITSLDISFEELEAYVKSLGLTAAQSAVKGVLSSKGLAEDAITVEAIDFNIVYNAWTTDDEFVCAVDATDISVTLGGSASSFILAVAQSAANTAVSTAVGNIYDTPIATIVVDGLAGGGADYFGQAETLLNFVNDDFAVDQTLLDFTANYDEYNGVVGQVNRVLVGLVDMLVTEGNIELKEGGNEYLTDNLQTICDKVNSMMAAANDLINNEELQGMIAQLGIDFDALTADLPLDLLYSLDFSSVEALWVTVITLGLDVIDTGDNELIAEIHALIGDLGNLDAMAVAVADYALADCIPALNDEVAKAGFDFALTVPAKTDAATVADGQGKDIIMTKAVDLLYEAAVEGVALVNDIANDVLETLEAKTGVEMPVVAFELEVAKAAGWEETLTALVDRVYELADGILLSVQATEDIFGADADVYDKLSVTLAYFLPVTSMLSNCGSEDIIFDVESVMGYLFDDALEGEFDGFLRLFETKEDDVAGDCSVTEALINASDYIVDSIFPDTVEAELYVNAVSDKFTETTVQEYFTSAENDQAIASRNMDSINARKAELVPAVLNLAREAGVLPFFAACDNSHDVENLVLKSAKVDSTCKAEGHEAIYECAECGYTVGGEIIAKKVHTWGTWTQTTAPACEATGVETRACSGCSATETRPVAATGHVTWGDWTQTIAPTCTAKGLETRTCSCGKAETREVAATGHPDADGNKICDVCNHDWNEKEETGFFAKIKAFFQKIIDWFKNLFS